MSRPLVKDKESGEIREMTDAELAQHELEQGNIAAEDAAQRIPRIREWAGKTICSRLPEWKQLNMLKESAQLMEKRMLSLFTPEDQQRIKDLKDWGAWVDQVRAESARLEADPELTVENAEVPTPPNSKP